MGTDYFILLHNFSGKKRKRTDPGSDPSQRKLNFTKVKRRLDYKTEAVTGDADQDSSTESVDKTSCASGKPENSDTARTRSRKDSDDRAENGELDFIVIDDETELVNPETEGLNGKVSPSSSGLKQGRSQSGVETVSFSQSSTGMFKAVDKNIPRGTKRVNKSGKKQKTSGQSTMKDFFKSRLR